MIFIPFISAALYLVGGQWWKPARWLLGIPIGLIGYFSGYGLPSMWCALTYFIATSAFPYGDSSWLNFLGEWGKWAVCGLVFGLSSMPILGIWSFPMGLISMIAFLILHWLDEKNIVKNPWQELLRGFLGTILLAFA